VGLAELPAASAPARQPITDLPASSALSILANGPASFAGRKVGALVTDGTDAGVLAALRAAIEGEGAVLELVAPRIGGVTLSDGSQVPAGRNIDGGPSVLYGAVAVLASAEGAAALAMDAATKDFVTDAHAHCKIIGHVAAATELLQAAGLADLIDEGYVALDTTGVEALITACRQLRFWDREPAVDAV
jgi:catalase